MEDDTEYYQVDALIRLIEFIVATIILIWGVAYIYEKATYVKPPVEKEIYYYNTATVEYNYYDGSKDTVTVERQVGWFTLKDGNLSYYKSSSYGQGDVRTIANYVRNYKILSLTTKSEVIQ